MELDLHGAIAPPRDHLLKEWLISPLHQSRTTQTTLQDPTEPATKDPAQKPALNHFQLNMCPRFNTLYYTKESRNSTADMTAVCF
jgi:hypothetical protein